MSDRDEIADVLAAHRLVRVSGGTATGSRWICQCGAEEINPGAREHAEHMHARHVAHRLTLVLRADDTLVERVAEAMAHADLDNDYEHRHDLARAAVAAILGGE